MHYCVLQKHAYQIIYCGCSYGVFYYSIPYAGYSQHKVKHFDWKISRNLEDFMAKSCALANVNDFLCQVYPAYGFGG
jgi:hypothetical protein